MSKPWVRMIAWQIAVADRRHRFRAAVRVSRARMDGHHKQHNRKRRQRRILLLHEPPLDDLANRNSVQDAKPAPAYLVPSLYESRRARARLPTYLVSTAGAAGILWLAAAFFPARAAPEIGAAAPALVAMTLEGQSFDLAKLRGKVVLVNYWATWCAPCRKEMPKLDAFYKRYHDRGLELIGISIDFPRDGAKVQKVAQKVSYPIALSQSINDNGFGDQKAVPFTWIIDTNGAIRDMMIDVRDDLLDGLVVPLLPH